jgi:outer membrane protein TolC
LGARARLSRAQVARERAREAVETAALRLRELLDLPETVTLVAADPLPTRLDLIPPGMDERGLIERALACRPELREARHLASAALAEQRGTTVGPLIPEVRLGYEGGLFGDPATDLGGTGRFGVGLEWVVGPGGIGDRPRQAAASARWSQSRLEIVRVRQRIVREVSSGLAEVRSRGEAIDIAMQASQEAAEAADLYRQRLAGGLGAATDILLAQETLTRARLDHLDALTGHGRASLRVLRALGGTP